MRARSLIERVYEQTVGEPPPRAFIDRIPDIDVRVLAGGFKKIKYLAEYKDDEHEEVILILENPLLLTHLKDEHDN